MYMKSLTVHATQDMMSSSYYTSTANDNDDPLSHILYPLSVQVYITLNRSTDPLKISDGPRVSIDVQLNETVLVVSQDQFNKFVDLSDTFKWRLISQKYRHLRPKSRIKEK